MGGLPPQRRCVLLLTFGHDRRRLSRKQKAKHRSSQQPVGHRNTHDASTRVMSPKFGCGAGVVLSALSASFWAFPLACWAFDFGFGGFHCGFLSLPLPRVYFTIGLKLGASGFPDSCPELRPSATTRQAPRTRKTARISFWFFGPSFPFIGLLAFNFLSCWPFGV